MIPRRKNSARYAAGVAALVVFVSAVLSCNGSGVRSLESIRKSGKLVVVTRNAPTTYYEDRDGSMAGMEYDMIVSFAAYMGVEPEFRVEQTISGLLDAIEKGKADVAAAGLTGTPERSRRFLVGPVYITVKELLVGRRDGEKPARIEEIDSTSLTVMAGSSYEERLVALKRSYPNITWAVNDDLDTEQLLEWVWRRKIDCTISDDNIFAINRRYYPELVAVFAVSEPESLAWLFPAGSEALRNAAFEWFEEMKARGELSTLLEKYYGHAQIFDYVDTRKFIRRIETVLPKYRGLFEQAAKKNRLDWTLLAAQSYQESHWNPGALSRTGVRGIMMLTMAAAQDLGVMNRRDPVQSIRGGARYLRQLIDRLPDTIVQPDRTWIALAAYNVGIAHLHDARKLARRLGKNPDRWNDLSEVLPLLARRKYHTTLEHGYARGSEPVEFVNRIRHYKDVLERTID